MNITIINTSDIAGGAARAAYRLHKGMRELNNDSIMIVKHKQSNDPNVHQVVPLNLEYSIEENIFNSIQKTLIDQNRTSISNTLFSFPYPGYNISHTDVIKYSDIINLHWINRFQSVETISNLLKLGKPVVWTLHDQWPFTGGCHYSAGCDNFVNYCKNCPQLKTNTYDIPFLVQQTKIEKFNKKNLAIVTPSRWLYSCVKKSKVFNNLRVEVIPYSLETDVFKPVPKYQAKKALNINADIITLLFGAHTHNEHRKGFKQLSKAISFCLQNDFFKKLIEDNKLNILIFGVANDDLQNIGIPVISTGYINSDEKLAEIYSAADIFLLPSLEDNLPNTMLESMACGTPIVAFDAGGIPDVIQHGITGFIAPCFSSEKFGELILNLIHNESKRIQMGTNCQRLMESKFQLKHQAAKYNELFKDLLKNIKLNKERKKGNSLNNTNGKIFLKVWESELQSVYYNIYRNSAIKLLNSKDEQIKNIFNGYKYRVGRLILSPIEMIVAKAKKKGTDFNNSK
jgi:glycosyltransferase involved in cell wall biosynthesis